MRSQRTNCCTGLLREHVRNGIRVTLTKPDPLSSPYAINISASRYARLRYKTIRKPANRIETAKFCAAWQFKKRKTGLDRVMKEDKNDPSSSCPSRCKIRFIYIVMAPNTAACSLWSCHQRQRIYAFLNWPLYLPQNPWERSREQAWKRTVLGCSASNLEMKRLSSELLRLVVSTNEIVVRALCSSRIVFGSNPGWSIK